MKPYGPLCALTIGLLLAAPPASHAQEAVAAAPPRTTRIGRALRPHGAWIAAAAAALRLPGPWTLKIACGLAAGAPGWLHAREAARQEAALDDLVRIERAKLNALRAIAAAERLDEQLHRAAAPSDDAPDPSDEAEDGRSTLRTARP